MLDQKSADAEGLTALSRERWERLRQEATAQVLSELARDDLASSLVHKIAPGAIIEPWAAHPHLWAPRNDDLPGALIWTRVECANGRSARVVYGCRGALLESWELTLAGPWPLEISIAAQIGDEARSEMCACFELGADPPQLARHPSSFSEDFSALAGSSTALVETSRAESAILALNLLTALASVWDAPEQAHLWDLARKGAPEDLAKELAHRPTWAGRPWSKGSSLLALCLRLGRWESVEVIVKACSPDALMQLAPEASRALAALCCDLAPAWPAALAVDAIGRAWACGVRLCPQSFCDALGSAEALHKAGRGAWRLAEKRALSATCSVGVGTGSHRL